MATPAALYINGIKEKLKNYWAPWLPSSKYSLGDVGILEGNLFKKLSSLKDLSISFDESQSNELGLIDYVSESGVEVSFEASGQVNTNVANIPEAKASINIRFTSMGAFVVQIPKTNEVSIDNLLSLQGSIISAFKSGLWDKNWVVITKIINAPFATFLISNSSKSNVEFEIEGDLNHGLAELGNAQAQLSLRSQTGDILKIIGAKDVTPFFQLSKLRFPIGRFPMLREAKGFKGEIDPMHYVTPEIAKKEEISNVLYFGLIN